MEKPAKETKTLGYDPNSPLTVMEQVQNVIKPPPSEEEKYIYRPSTAKHPYYRKPGRGHNHDWCDACEEGGDLLCCDRCPSSFHLQCHDPPLTDDDIPSGQWMCHNCRMTTKITTTSSSKSSSVEPVSISAVPSVISTTGATAASRPNSPSGSDLDAALAKVRNLRKRSSSHASFSSENSSGNNTEKKYCFKLPDVVQKDLDPNRKSTPWDEIIRAATMLNPKQFELPRELEIHSQFPGNDKVQAVQRCNGNNNGNKKPNVRRNSKPYELDSQGLVPLPAKTCFYCRKSCKKAPLVACDYCDLFYHQDCLDPPMTSFPSGLWMCPNHAMNFVDNQMRKSISITERVRLWNKFSQPLDHEAVKMEFFRRVHMKNPPFRIRIPIKQRETIEIPPMVKWHYENPPALLPSMREALRYDAVKRRKCFAREPLTISRESLTESLVKDFEALQNAKAKFREIQKEFGNLSDLSSSSSSSSSSSDSDENEGQQNDNKNKKENDVKKQEQQSPIGDTTDQNINSEKSSQPLQKSVSKKRNRRSEKALRCNDPATQTFNAINSHCGIEAELKFCGTKRKHIESESNAADDEDDDEEIKPNTKIDAELNCLDVDLIKKLAYQRLDQLIQENPEIIAQYQNRTTGKRLRELIEVQNSPRNTTAGNVVDDDDGQRQLPSQILEPKDVRRLAIMFTSETSSILAERQASNGNDHELHPALATAAAIVAADEAEEKYTPKVRTDAEKAYEIATRLELKFKRRKIRARAVLTPIGDMLEDDRWFCNVDLKSSYFMRYRSLNIGYGTDSPLDVNLSLVGYCRHISSKHAVIFFDDFTKTFELINYSEYGTEVNGQLYSCDFTEHNTTPANKLKNGNHELHKQLMEIIDKRRGIQRQQVVLDRNAKMAPPPKPECNCIYRPEPPMVPGAWEGTAILPHGSLIRFGCLSFVFSIPKFDSLTNG